MKKRVLLPVLTLLFPVLLAGQLPLFGQNASPTPDSLAQERRQKPSLPEIQLKEYTIVGLSKVSLPEKHRFPTAKKVEIRWVNNTAIWHKEPPRLDLTASRKKPVLLQLYQYPWLNSEAGYGSFNTFRLGVNTQFGIGQVLPYLSARYARSDGHVTNAQWANTRLQAGIHLPLGRGQLLHLGTDYRFSKRGIWNLTPTIEPDREAQAAFWSFFGHLDQQWSERFQSRLQAAYRNNEQRNRYDYRESGLDARASGWLQFSAVTLEAQLHYQTSRFDRQGALPLPPDSGKQTLFQGNLFTGTLALQPRWQNLIFHLGIRWQNSQETLPVTPSETRRIFNPDLGVKLRFGKRGNLGLYYRPGLALWRLERSVRLLPFSDFEESRLVDYRQRWLVNLTYRVGSALDFSVTGELSTADHYLVATPTMFRQWNGSAWDTLNYPGWSYRSAGQVKLWDLGGRIRWQFLPAWELRGWVNLRGSQIETPGSLSGPVRGKKIPYFPELVADAALKWRFFRRHTLSVNLQYTSERYDDPENRVRLEPFVLLNAALQFHLSPHLQFLLRGENLLDNTYQQWQGFVAPGIRGMAEVRFSL